MSKLFKIYVWTEKLLLISPNIESIGPEDYQVLAKRIKDNFVECKWHNNENGRGWAVPSMKETVEFLNKYYIEGRDYDLDRGAKIALVLEKVSDAVHEETAKKRYKYLYESESTNFIIPTMDNFRGEEVKPYMHQRIAVESMVNMPEFGLLMDMGTGKTKCIIWELMEYAIHLPYDKNFRACIVCPKTLRTNWKREIDSTFLDAIDLSVSIVDHDIKGIEQLISLMSAPERFKVAILSYDSLRSMLKAVKMFLPHYIAFDESQYVKNSESLRYKNCKEIAILADKRRILSGTPVSNTICDLFSQFELLKEGSLGCTTFTAFKKMYLNLENIGGFDKIVGYRHVDELKKRMAQISLTVKKEHCLDLPEKVYKTRYVDMHPETRKFYDDVVSNMVAELENGAHIEIKHLIVLLTRLSQICCGFINTTITKEEDAFDELGVLMGKVNVPIGHESHPVPGINVKLGEMLEETMEVIKTGKVIIWCRFRRDIEVIQQELLLNGVNSVVINGGVSEEDRVKAIDLFNTDPRYRVFLGQTGAGGVGITLLGDQHTPGEACTTVFYYSNTYTYGTRAQSEDRCHRIGQKNKVVYIDWVYENSIEERVLNILMMKKDLSENMKDISSIKALLLGE